MSYCVILDDLNASVGTNVLLYFKQLKVLKPEQSFYINIKIYFLKYPNTIGVTVG